MHPFISKYFSSILMACVIVVSFFVFIFQLVSVNASRDARSNSIRRIEKECVVRQERIKSLEALKERQQNAALLKHNPALPENFTEEVPSQCIIRVRPMSTPYGAGRSSSARTPKTLAVELSELAVASGY
ncbi:MAG: hypothetical protein IJX22_05035 [Opitutales bacterium]|nr:hypothetical protein [Opitutales bacterium]